MDAWTMSHGFLEKNNINLPCESSLPTWKSSKKIPTPLETAKFHFSSLGEWYSDLGSTGRLVLRPVSGAPFLVDAWFGKNAKEDHIPYIDIHYIILIYYTCMCLYVNDIDIWSFQARCVDLPHFISQPAVLMEHVRSSRPVHFTHY